ncbi:MAG: hypothetical protein ABIS86_00280 [Streptosporangiaceae bacterium]
MPPKQPPPKRRRTAPKPPPNQRKAGPKPPPKKTTRVRDYTRTDGTKVRSHNRSLAWQQARAAWVGVGITGITTTGLIAEFGLNLVSTIFLVLTALVTWVAVWASQKANGNKAKMRAAAKARKRPTTRRR